MRPQFLLHKVRLGRRGDLMARHTSYGPWLLGREDRIASRAPSEGSAGGAAATLRSILTGTWRSSAWRSAQADRGELRVGRGLSLGFATAHVNLGSIRLVAATRTICGLTPLTRGTRSARPMRRRMRLT